MTPDSKRPSQVLEDGTVVFLGDWVSVQGQVTGFPVPEDLVVEFFSHSDQWRGAVRVDTVLAKIDPPEGSRCTHMYSMTVGSYVRCESHLGHSEDHHMREIRWTDSQSAGYFEAAR